MAAGLLNTVVLICLCGSGAAHDTKAAISEKTYKQAARHCHSDRVIRLRRDKQTTVMVNGLLPPGERELPGVRVVECVRRYLDIPRQNVVILAN